VAVTIYACLSLFAIRFCIAHVLIVALAPRYLFSFEGHAMTKLIVCVHRHFGMGAITTLSRVDLRLGILMSNSNPAPLRQLFATWRVTIRTRARATRSIRFGSRTNQLGTGAGALPAPLSFRAR